MSEAQFLHYRIDAIEVKVGVDNSLDLNSFDARVRAVEIKLGMVNGAGSASIDARMKAIEKKMKRK